MVIVTSVDLKCLGIGDGHRTLNDDYMEIMGVDRPKKHMTGWWFQIFLIFTPKLGEDSHFDEHIFQRGWFNHQLDEQ